MTQWAAVAACGIQCMPCVVFRTLAASCHPCCCVLDESAISATDGILYKSHAVTHCNSILSARQKSMLCCVSRHCAQPDFALCTPVLSSKHSTLPAVGRQLACLCGLTSLLLLLPS